MTESSENVNARIITDDAAKLSTNNHDRIN